MLWTSRAPITRISRVFMTQSLTSWSSKTVMDMGPGLNLRTAVQQGSGPESPRLETDDGSTGEGPSGAGQ
ncbi:Hypothetical protein FKW44_017777 [Caligus rogercresseyi]|uniref:Uncharacterized protein n=1 Tax=Caligus rogercresseyi TaxID=217165 RepID=A0A7T8JXH5_CALRO|nr:Hypothetical protein FKW44_017777 [Caligus rogercresseyi]